MLACGIKNQILTQDSSEMKGLAIFIYNGEREHRLAERAAMGQY